MECTLSSFENKVVLITGAASGFGKILADKLAAFGARLVLGDLNEAGLRKVAEDLRGRHGAQVVDRRCDVSIEADSKALVEAAVEAFGALDIAVNNAGISRDMKLLIETTEEEMDVNFAVNTKGVFFGMKHQITQMLTARSGIILNVSSMAGIGGAPRLGAYCASKHAVVGLTKTAAVEYGSKNIRCNAICPYYSPTPLLEGSPVAERPEIFAQGTPMKRLGEPEEIVEAMLMLIAPQNSYLNGQAVAVDGGLAAW